MTTGGEPTHPEPDRADDRADDRGAEKENPMADVNPQADQDNGVALNRQERRMAGKKKGRTTGKVPERVRFGNVPNSRSYAHRRRG